jgi:hypothetical protein
MKLAVEEGAAHYIGKRGCASHHAALMPSQQDI